MTRILGILPVVFLSAHLMAGAQTRTIAPLFSFACPNTQFGTCPDGYSPDVLIQASDGSFYGAAQLTTFGTSNPHGGTLYRLTPRGQFKLLFTFAADSSGNYVNGDNPANALVEANDGFLYGTAFEGGATNNGVLFRIRKNGTEFSVVHNFCSVANCADGSSPASLIVGHDGSLYGTTTRGGSNTGNCQPLRGCGTIYRFTPHGTFTTLHVLNGTTDSAFPGGMIQGSDGTFYGTVGVFLFSFVPGGQFNTFFAFPKTSFVPPSADSPLLQASNGNLYGGLTTYHINQVQFYEIAPSGSGFQEFPAIGTLSGIFAIGNLIQASDGDLWTAFVDTHAGNGTVVAMSPDTGAVLQRFLFDGPNGSLPEGGVLQGADGKIYGTTIGGGTLTNGKAPSGAVWVLDAGLAPPQPATASFSPASGAPGAKVLIRGSNFIGTTAVTFNGVSASFHVLNTQFISATVPAGATTGPIAITNAGGTAQSAGSFTVQ